MALEIKAIERVFVFKKGNEQIILDDINPNLTPDEIIDMYSNTYPELVNSNINPKGIVNDQLVYEISSVAGTKA